MNSHSPGATARRSTVELRSPYCVPPGRSRTAVCRLSVDRSATELQVGGGPPGDRTQSLRVNGPALLPLELEVLVLHPRQDSTKCEELQPASRLPFFRVDDGRTCRRTVIPPAGVEPAFSGSKPDCLPLADRGIQVETEGIEPASSVLQTDALTTLATSPFAYAEGELTAI